MVINIDLNGDHNSTHLCLVEGSFMDPSVAEIILCNNIVVVNPTDTNRCWRVPTSAELMHKQLVLGILLFTLFHLMYFYSAYGEYTLLYKVH